MPQNYLLQHSSVEIDVINHLNSYQFKKKNLPKNRTIQDRYYPNLKDFIAQDISLFTYPIHFYLRNLKIS